MNRSFINIIFLILVLVSSQLIIFACAGPQEIPEGEKKYIEGVVVDSSIHGFRVRDDTGNVISFTTRDEVEYQPLEFHAYYGDRVGVTYYTIIKSGKDWHKALRVALLATNPNRIDFGYGAYGSVDGIIRASGWMRYLVYLPKNDLTVAFYKIGEVKTSPRNWRPKKGNKVTVYYSEDSGRFTKRFKCYRINRLGEDLVSIQDKTEPGVITEIFVHRSAKRAPDRFAFQLKNGDTWTLFAGGETTVFPTGIKVKMGESYLIDYYRLLLGNQSIRYVATMIRVNPW